MAKTQDAVKTQKIAKPETQRPERAKLSAQKSLERMEKFSERAEKFIATIREGRLRGTG
jgi:hypothetical protein